jgi:hypothetical protein
MSSSRLLHHISSQPFILDIASLGRRPDFDNAAHRVYLSLDFFIIDLALLTRMIMSSFVSLFRLSRASRILIIYLSFSLAAHEELLISADLKYAIIPLALACH